ncbi:MULTISPECIES: hypothetical protein [unclassified Microbacterium]|uniref:hypothetical protein n=1 Tax=unclassified Microbacterium TaxID=2609290 RepID=UPI000EA884A9|nr:MULTISPECIES: hypothetical protein [unclassified Microbacterium]MBT2483250.1 hypothetical protein [Microbacterium sp. ISL-108]RKN66294.1 hypothetical protein D7252_00900 [Microbacterium sp. CGR2]
MIGRALRAQARSLAGDVVLLGVCAAALLLSLSLAMTITPEFADSPLEVREALAAPFGTVLTTYGAVLAAVYGSFRYTIDRRDGVVAQRLMLQPRWTTFLVRLPVSALGGAVVSLVGLAGGHTALALVMGTVPVDWSSIAGALAVGAVAGLWGMGLGMIVQAHLVALFVASMSMGVAMLVVTFWSAGAVYLPVLALLEAFRFDVTAVGVLPDDRLGSSLAALVSAGWVLAALLAGGITFMNRDVR